MHFWAKSYWGTTDTARLPVACSKYIQTRNVQLRWQIAGSYLESMWALSGLIKSGILACFLSSSIHQIVILWYDSVFCHQSPTKNSMWICVLTYAVRKFSQQQIYHFHPTSVGIC